MLKIQIFLSSERYTANYIPCVAEDGVLGLLVVGEDVEGQRLRVLVHISNGGLHAADLNNLHDIEITGKEGVKKYK